MAAPTAKFNPVQDARSETLRRPIASLGESLADQPHDQFEFVVPSLSPERPLEGTEAENQTNGIARETFSGIGYEARPARRILRLPTAPVPRERFIVLQKWEGTVISIEKDEFTAVVRDLTNPRHPEEQVTLLLGDVADGDRQLLAPGAIFYWAMGYKVNLFGGRERVASLRFRRLPALTARDLRDIRREAERLRELFGETR
ncbi:MAG: hypothetical protein HYS14_11080 [Candidatus Rokubacteria bacterium]|nr:hypothetical protein [Candidatus Rokubacteria bacterium]